MMKQSNANREPVKCYLCVLLIAFLLSSCSREDKEVRALKKVSKEYVTAFSSSFEEVIASYKENTIVLIIDQLDENHPLVKMYPDYSIYVFFYINSFYGRLDRSELPSKLFYSEGYPVAFYSNHLPAMKKNDIPKSIYRKPKRGTLVDDGNSWYVVICKKSHKYKVLPDPNLEPFSVIFGQGLKDFSCD